MTPYELSEIRRSIACGTPLDLGPASRLLAEYDIRDLQVQELQRKVTEAYNEVIQKNREAESALRTARNEADSAKEARLQRDELRKHLGYVCMIAERLGPKAHNTHREEALAMLDGTVADAREIMTLRPEGHLCVRSQFEPRKVCGDGGDAVKAKSDGGA